MDIKHALHPNSIRRFVLLWMSGLVLCFAVLAVSLVVTTNKLHTMNVRIFHDSRELESAHQLEISILAVGRDDLLWRTMNDELHRQQRIAELEQAGRLVNELAKSVQGSSTKGQLILTIKSEFDKFRFSARSDPPVPIRKFHHLSDGVLKAVENFREHNREKMLGTIRASATLDTLVDRWSQGVIIFVTFAVIIGALILIYRIIQPTFALTRAAKKFGDGDRLARAKVYRDDELGMLCKTFNDMAHAITKLEQDRQNFVAAVAHDLKNPLVVIGAAALRLKKKSPVTEEESIWLDCIIGRVGFLEKAISDLMDSVQIERGNLSLQVCDLELTSLVQDICRIQSQLTPTHRILFEADGECRMKGDRRRLERVVTNLISNAVKYSPPNSAVLLKVRSSDSKAVISVKDEGVGMSKEEIEKLFQPFQRLSRTKGLAEGTGLGLFSVKRIVEAHGGAIEIISAPGVGTTVETTLPVTNSC